MDSVRDGLLLSLRLLCVVFSKDGYAMTCSLVARPCFQGLAKAWRRNTCAERLRCPRFSTRGKLSLMFFGSMSLSGFDYDTAQSISESSDKEKTHALPDDNIISDGAKHFRCTSVFCSQFHRHESQRSPRLSTIS